MGLHRHNIALVAGIVFLILGGLICAQEPARPIKRERPEFPMPARMAEGGIGAARAGDQAGQRRIERQIPTNPEARRAIMSRGGPEGFAGGPGGFGGGASFLMRNIELFDTDGDGALSRQEYEDGMREIFERLDANGDGKVDRAEMSRDLSTIFVPPATRSRQLLRAYDQNNDGKITAEECLLPPKAFADLDINKSGALESEDLIKLTLAKTALLQDPARRAAALLAELDKNGDKKLSPEEFELGKAVFKQTDRNADGLLDADELKTLPPLPADSPLRRAEEMIARMDQDGDKMLSQNEFRVPGGRFEDLDTNKDGLVDLKEMVAWFESARGRQFGPPSGVEMADRILERFDRNGDGKLTKEELQGMPEATWQRWDLNGDGVVEGAEIEKSFEVMGGGRGRMAPNAPGPGPAPGGPRGELLRGNPADIIKARDQDGDGKLTAKELGLEERTFQLLDRDGDGKVTAEELATALDVLRSREPELRNKLRERRDRRDEGKP